MIIKNKQKSFTLIELLVVIVIIGILAGVIMISTSSSIDKANFAKAQAFSSTVQNELLSNLVSEWTFDNASNIGEDTWGNNHGTLYGSAGSQNLPQLQSASKCVFGTCLKFDGVDDYIDCGNLGIISDNFTFSTWFKTSSTKTYNPILMIDGNMIGNPQLRTSNGKAEFRFYDANSLRSSVNFNDNKWHYVVGGINSEGKYFLYIDGDDCGTLTPNKTLNWTGNTIIARYSYSSGSYFDGLIDDIRIYNTALSSSQIKQNYIAGLNSLLSNGNLSKQEYNERINALSYEE